MRVGWGVEKEERRRLREQKRFAKNPGEIEDLNPAETDKEGRL